MQIYLFSFKSEMRDLWGRILYLWYVYEKYYIWWLPPQFQECPVECETSGHFM